MKRAFGFLIAATMVLSSAIAKEARQLPPVKQIVSLDDLTAETMNDLIYGGVGDLVIECREGSQIPVKSLKKMSVFSAALIPNLTVQLEQLCYLRFIGRRGYISYDLVNWEKASKMFAWRTLRTNRGFNSSGATVQSVWHRWSFSDFDDASDDE